LTRIKERKKKRDSKKKKKREDEVDKPLPIFLGCVRLRVPLPLAPRFEISLCKKKMLDLSTNFPCEFI